MATYISSLLCKPVAGAVAAQTDEEHKVAANQCSWCAHQFVQHGLALIKHFEGGNTEEYVSLHNVCLKIGTALRKAQLAAGPRVLSWGENLDDPTMLAHTRAMSAAAAGTEACDTPAHTRAIQAAPDVNMNGVRFAEPRITVMREEIGLALMADLPAELADTFYSLTRHPRASEDEFAAALAALPAGGFILLERYGLTFAILRTHAGDKTDPSAYLVTDSHCHEAGGMSFEHALTYAKMDQGGCAAITWLQGVCVPVPVPATPVGAEA